MTGPTAATNGGPDLIDVLHIEQVPVLLGRGVRPWDGLEGIEVVSSLCGVTHLTFTRRYAIARAATVKVD